MSRKPISNSFQFSALDIDLHVRFLFYEAMGKIQVDHKVVVRDENDNEIRSKNFPHHAAALPEFERQCVDKASGHVITLQHGARVLRKG